jgi:hypothetical protein
MSGSFVNRLLRATLILPQGTFPGTDSNTLVLDNLRMSARLTGSGNWTNFCDLSIYGMRQVDMSAVTVLFGQGGTITAINARALLILESNDGSGWLQVFEGQFQQAQADYRSLPDVNLMINAATGAGQQYLAAQPSSFAGSIDVVTVAELLASQMGFAFEDNGVEGTIATPYLSGTLMDQFRALALAGNFDYYFDAKSTLIICPKNEGRQDKTAIAVNPDSGLVGYPVLGQYGIDVDVLFSPAIELGSPITISNSQVPGADGTWYPRTAVHELETIKQGGRWFSHLQCSPFPLAA